MDGELCVLICETAADSSKYLFFSSFVTVGQKFALYEGNISGHFKGMRKIASGNPLILLNNGVADSYSLAAIPTWEGEGDSSDLTLGTFLFEVCYFALLVNSFSYLHDTIDY